MRFIINSLFNKPQSNLILLKEQEYVLRSFRAIRDSNADLRRVLHSSYDLFIMTFNKIAMTALKPHKINAIKYTSYQTKNTFTKLLRWRYTTPQ